MNKKLIVLRQLETGLHGNFIKQLSVENCVSVPGRSYSTKRGCQRMQFTMGFATNLVNDKKRVD
ncbi:MAG: hypothetical protein CW691_06305 [Candidatus Bathyarchaeum sp.]|nr:MAG: hypothetical protein CW691_06305 [Candidatus Bathyarchaeum sp.]